jgi:hypothetical protein
VVEPGYLGYPYGYGYGDTGDDDSADSTVAQNYPADGYDGQAPPPDQVATGRAPYQPSYGVTQSAPGRGSASATEDAVTILFKDGRPSEQIHNYLLSRTTLSVLDEHYRVIPIDQVDLAATEKVNRAAGVDFHLPDSSQ